MPGPRTRVSTAVLLILSAGLGLIGLWLLWRATSEFRTHLFLAMLIPVLSWGSFFPALLLPETTAEDVPDESARVLGLPVNLFVAAVFVALSVVRWPTCSSPRPRPTSTQAKRLPPVDERTPMNVLEFATLVITGFVACAEFGSYAFVHPVIRRLPPTAHLQVEQGLLRTFGRVMPVGMTLCVVLAISSAVGADGDTRLWRWLAAKPMGVLPGPAVLAPAHRFRADLRRRCGEIASC